MQFRELETDTHWVDVSGSERKKNEKVVWSITRGLKEAVSVFLGGRVEAVSWSYFYFGKKKTKTKPKKHIILVYPKPSWGKVIWNNRRLKLLENSGSKIKHKVFKISPQETEMSKFLFLLFKRKVLCFLDDDYPNPKSQMNFSKSYWLQEKEKDVVLNWLNGNIIIPGDWTSGLNFLLVLNPDSW